MPASAWKLKPSNLKISSKMQIFNVTAKQNTVCKYYDGFYNA